MCLLLQKFYFHHSDALVSRQGSIQPEQRDHWHLLHSSGRVGSVLGGWLADKGFAAYPDIPEGRFIYGWPVMWLLPLATVGFGESLIHGGSLAAVLITTAVAGVSFGLPFNIMFGFLATARPHAQATAVAVMLFLAFAGSGVLVSISVIISEAIGVEYFLLLFSCVALLGDMWSTYAILNAVLWSKDAKHAAVLQGIIDVKEEQSDQNETVLQITDGDVTTVV